jgi:hypothetical protein
MRLVMRERSSTRLARSRLGRLASSSSNWISPRRTRALPALARPFSRRFEPLSSGDPAFKATLFLERGFFSEPLSCRKD